MTIIDFIENIYKTGNVQDKSGNEFDIRISSISKNEGEFIYEIVKNNNIKNTIEIGCGFGMSSLFICAGLKNKKLKHHTIIDPNQSTQYKNIGINNLKNVNIDYFDLIEEPSELALPGLMRSQKKFEFGFIDGWHTFDHTLLDFFYLNRMLHINGIIVIDDISYPSIHKLMRYLTQYPCYEVIGTVDDKLSTRKKLARFLLWPLKQFSKLLPYDISTRIFDGEIFLKNKKFKSNTTMIALKKVKVDERSYDWFKKF
jgi:predicted O-methyltransferase YrrM